MYFYIAFIFFAEIIPHKKATKEKKLVAYNKGKIISYFLR